MTAFPIYTKKRMTRRADKALAIAPATRLTD
jgi:hypothetical protein